MNNNRYETLSQATEELKKRGYGTDFNLKADGIENPGDHKMYDPANFTVDEYHRFEGISNPSDMSIIFAVSTKDGTKGILIDAYGTYDDPLTSEMLKKFKLEE